METKEMVRQEETMPTFAMNVDEVKRRFQELQDFVKSQMKEGEDYGLIPGCPKPSLFKPGAEKLATLYGFSPRLEVVEKTNDWEKGFFAYMIKCTLVSKRTGFIVAEGIGSCNSREKRYRNQDGYSLDNTILKMAKKRALVDAVLTATRTSGIFTQDVEDMEINGHVEKDDPNGNTVTQHHNNTSRSDVPATDKQQAAIFAICKAKHLDKVSVCQQFNTTPEDMTKSEASEIIDWLQEQK